VSDGLNKMPNLHTPASLAAGVSKVQGGAKHLLGRFATAAAKHRKPRTPTYESV
jgi:hypothetical protein